MKKPSRALFLPPGGGLATPDVIEYEPWVTFVIHYFMPLVANFSQLFIAVCNQNLVEILFWLFSTFYCDFICFW